MDKYAKIIDKILECELDYAMFSFNDDAHSSVCHGGFLWHTVDEEQDGEVVDLQILHTINPAFNEVFEWMTKNAPFSKCFKDVGVHGEYKFTVQDTKDSGALPVFFNLQQMRLMRTRRLNVETYMKARKEGANIPVALLLANSFYVADYEHFGLMSMHDFKSVYPDTQVHSAMKVYKDGGDFLSNPVFESDDYYFFKRMASQEVANKKLTFYKLFTENKSISEIVKKAMEIYETV